MVAFEGSDDFRSLLGLRGVHLIDRWSLLRFRRRCFHSESMVIRCPGASSPAARLAVLDLGVPELKFGIGSLPQAASLVHSSLDFVLCYPLQSAFRTSFAPVSRKASLLSQARHRHLSSSPLGPLPVR